MLVKSDEDAVQSKSWASPLPIFEAEPSRMHVSDPRDTSPSHLPTFVYLELKPLETAYRNSREIVSIAVIYFANKRNIKAET